MQHISTIRGRFLSIKWKLLLLLSVALFSINSVLSLLEYDNLIAQFEQQRTLVREQHIIAANALRSDATQKLQQSADMLTSMVGLVGFSDYEKLKDSINVYWTSLQLNLVIDSLRLYNPNGHLLDDWSNTQLPVSTKELDAVTTALKQERPITWLDCQQTCLQAVATPVLSAGQLAGVVVVNGSMSDMIVTFKRLTNADIGLLVPIAANAQNLPNLGMRVAGLSNLEKNLPLLKRLKLLPQIKSGQRWVKLSFNNKIYDLVFQSIAEDDGKFQSAMMVIIEDVSADYALIRSQTLHRLWADMIASFTILALLAFLLGKPLIRMTQAVETIPLLGQRAFAEVRSRIRLRVNVTFEDEVDYLNQAAVTLSNRLEDLESEVEARANDMRAMLKTISVERDFNNRLLNTAQVIILTQNRAGVIQTINGYGEVLIGSHEDEVRGQSFFDIICHENSTNRDMQQVILDVAAGHEEHIYRESVLIGRDGIRRDIAWSHSRLIGETGIPEQVLSIGLDITQRKEAEKRIVWLAEHDQLTGLSNRQAFQNNLEQALAVARRTGRQGALLFSDLDGFKYVNDVSGHQAGDALLRAVADEMLTVMRETDQLARLGGDEFGVLLHDCNLAGAIEVAEKINRRLIAINFPGLGASHRVSASIGIVIFPISNMDVKQVLASADIAMYQAKAAGRGGWHVYAEGERMQEKFQQWVEWEEKIKKALEQNGFVMHYQPILDLHTNKISHYEALVRMHSDEDSPITATCFIEIAEKCGLIRELDRHIVSMVVDHLLVMLADGSHCKIAVNLSGISINDDGLLDFLRQQLARDPRLPQHLIFEITETAAVADFSAARTFMQAVRELGCAFSLDDFGVGFSSFYYIKHLPVDYVKIDGSFIRTLADSPDDQVFVRALAEVARGFGKKTVAEFVEDERILPLLRAYGVDYAQGHSIGKPSERTDL